MTTLTKTKITVQTTVNAPIEKAWKIWNEPEHITKWCTGSPDWHTPYAENDLRVGGKLRSRMEAKDGSAGFDLVGTYTNVQKHKMIEYTMEDGRNVKITFSTNGKTTTLVETFEAENENPLEMQKEGWQTILNNFKAHVESIQ
ncbi:MAG: SRPBCC family protein [Bacteroidota bacterium]|nr:SRPBCC family protein [Bacteroidota bacterium]